MTRNQDDSVPNTSNRKRYRRILVLVVVVLLIWFAPKIIVMSPLRYVLLDKIKEHFQGPLRYDAINVGWLQPVSITQVEAFDLNGELLLTARQVYTQKPLYALLTSGTHLGAITVDQPQLFVSIRHDGSNLSDALAAAAPADEQTSTTPAAESSPLRLTILITNGSAKVVDVETNHTITATALDATIDFYKPNDAAINVRVDGNIGLNQQAAGKLHLELTGDSLTTERGEPSFAGNLTLDATQFPLVAANLLTRPWNIQADGWCNVRLRGRLRDGRADVHIDQLAASDLTVAAPELLGEDVLRLARAEMSGNVSVSEDWISLESVELHSDVAELTANGTLRIPQSANQVLRTVEESLQGVDQHVTGTVDLAALAAMLPHTLHLRDGARITSGQLVINLQNDSQQDKGRIVAQLTASGVAGEVNGKHIEIGEPVDVRATLRQASDGPAIDELTLRSDFLALDGTGSIAQGQVNLSGDLGKLAQQWGPLVKLDGMELGGTLRGLFQWQRQPSMATRVHGNVVVNDLVVVAPTIQPWRERQLTVDVDGQISTSDMNLQRVEQGTLAVSSGDDQLTCTLLQPVNTATDSTPLSLRCAVVGDLTSWQARLQPLLEMPEVRLAGKLDLNTNISVSGDLTEVRDCALDVVDLRCSSESLAIEEPQLTMKGAFSWNHVTQEARSTGLTLASSSLAFHADGFQVLLSEDDFRGSGDIGFRGDVGRLSRWIRDDQTVSATQPAGEITGRLSLTQRGEVTQISLNSAIDKLDYYARETELPDSPLQLQWSEPNVQLAGTATYDTRNHTATLTQFQIGANTTARVLATGTLRDPGGACIVDIQGELSYDLSRVAARLRPVVGADLELSGNQSRTFSLRGPLFATTDSESPVIHASTHTDTGQKTTKLISEELSGSASVVWDNANYAGFAAGPGEVSANLGHGIIAVDPINVGVSGGELQAKPRILLNETPALMVLDKGPVVQNVQISPDMCRGWLKFVAPMMANATEVQGRFSTDLEGAIMPLAAPTTGNVKGKIHIHTARVGPGPMSREFLSIAQQVAAVVRGRDTNANLATTSWLDMPEQTVEFQLVNGRVYHRGMQFVGGGEVAIHTSGSVGLDQSVDIVAVIPVRDEWTQRSDWLAGLRGQSFQIPIRGTLSDPSVDSRVLEQLGKQTLRGTANKLLEEGLQRGLQKLFGN